jgi:hypothetical protein
MVGSATESGALRKSKGALSGAAETVADVLRPGHGASEPEKEPRKASRSSGTSARRGKASQEAEE